MSDVQAGGKPSKGTPKDKRLKENKPKVTKSSDMPSVPDLFDPSRAGE